MLHSVSDASPAISTQETIVERYLTHTALCSKRTHLVVGQVAWHITQRLAVAMRAHYRLCRNVERIVERLLAGMTHIHHHSQAVHLAYHLRTEWRYTAVSVERAACRVAYLVVAIVTQSNVDDTSVGKVLHVMQVVLYRQTVFYTDHQRFPSLTLVAQQVLTVAGKGDVARIAKHYLINLVEDKVSISLRCVHVER